MAIAITQKKKDQVLRLELSGRLGAMETRDFDAAFREAAQGVKEALLDFSNVEYISSAGLRSLFLAKKTMTQQGGDLKILHPTEEVMDVFKATRYDNIITIVTGEEEKEPLFYPLRPVQRWMVDTHFQAAESTMMNTGALVRLDPAVDMEMLAEALNSIMAEYDIFRCRLVFHPETGDICQRFDGEVPKIVVETLSDEALVRRKEELKLPYELIDHPLYRGFLMVTPTAQYVYFDFHHAIMDGAAIAMILWRELDKRYSQLVKGLAPKVRQVHQYSSYILEEQAVPKEDLQAGYEYWRQMLSGFSVEKHLPPQDLKGEKEELEYEIEVPFGELEKNFFRGKAFSENTFFIGAALLALAKACGRQEAILGWVHNGRFTSTERRLMGLMLQQFPLRWTFDRPMTALDYLEALERKIAEGMEQRRSLDIVYEEGLQDDVATFILQKGSMGRRGSMKLGDTEAVIEEMPANEIAAVDNILYIEMNSHDDGTYSLVLKYDNSRYSQKAMRDFAAVMEKMVQGLLPEDGQILDLLK